MQYLVYGQVHAAAHARFIETCIKLSKFLNGRHPLLPQNEHLTSRKCGMEKSGRIGIREAVLARVLAGHIALIFVPDWILDVEWDLIISTRLLDGAALG